MQNRCDKTIADSLPPLELRVYTSRLLGSEPDLVLHGGGNTSVKTDDTLFVKGSGWNLDTIETSGFAPVSLEALLEMSRRQHLEDSEMVALQRAALKDISAPDPSIEAILHALIPFAYVDHTHADAVVTISNTPDGRRRLEELYGPDMLIVDYVMPGFDLAAKVKELTGNIDWNSLEGIILMHHGVFTFDDDAIRSYDKMIETVNRAEKYLQAYTPAIPRQNRSLPLPLQTAESIRRQVSRVRGMEVEISILDTPEAMAVAEHPERERIVHGGGLTPEHVIRIKPFPALLDPENPISGIDAFVRGYDEYFRRFSRPEHRQLDRAPRYAVMPGTGALIFAADEKERLVIADIAQHTFRAMLYAEKMGGWQSLGPSDLFAMEYWELEQAKLRKKK